MTDQTLAITIKANSEAARAEITRTVQAVKDLGQASVVSGAEAKEAANELTAAQRAAAAAVAQSTAQARGAVNQLTASLGGRGSPGAAGAVGNLTAQFNDLGVMWASGQNPLQTAIQQGTQITQVIGPMGAGGAVKALSAAFMGMLNPVSLVTIGGIAAIGMLVQWGSAALRSSEDTRSLEDRVKDLTNALTAYKAFADIAGKSTEDLRAEFGDFAEEMKDLAGYLAQVSVGRALDALGTESNPLLAGLRDAVKEVKELQAATERYQTIASGAGGATSEQILTAAEALAVFQDRADAAAAKVGLLPEQAAAISAAFDSLSGATSMTEIRDRSAEVLDTIRQFYPEGSKLPPALADAAVQLDAIAAAAARGLAVMDDTAGATGKAADKAQELLAKLHAEAEINALILKYGEKSAEVVNARAAAERSVAEQSIAAMNASEEMKQKLLDALDATLKLRDVDLESGLRAAGSLAGTIADRFAEAARNAWDAAGAMGAANFPERMAGAANLDISDDRVNRRDQIGWRNNPVRTTTPARTGGGAAASDSFAALQDEARSALTALDIAVAAINEKVRAGLLSTAAGTEAIGAAKRSAADALAELIPKIERATDASGPEAAAAVEQWRTALKGLGVEVDTVGDKLSKTMTSGFSSAFAAFIAGTKSGKDAFADFASSIQSAIANMMAQRFTERFVAPLFDSLFEAFGFADGGVPGGAGLSAYSNQVVDRPTTFAMPGGTGLMGEAGPEAILPLKRAAGGGLGVQSSAGVLPLRRQGNGALGVELPKWAPSILERPNFTFARGGAFGTGGASFESAGPGQPRGAPGQPGAVTVNVTNKAEGAEAKVSERMEGHARIIDVIVERVEAAMVSNAQRGVGPLSDLLSGSYGLQRAVR